MRWRQGRPGAVSISTQNPSPSYLTEEMCASYVPGSDKESCTESGGVEHISYCLAKAAGKIGKSENFVNTFLLLSDYNPGFSPPCTNLRLRKQWPEEFDPNYQFPEGSEVATKWNYIHPNLYYGAIDYYQYIPFYMNQCSSMGREYMTWYKEDLKKLGYDPADHWRYFNPGAAGMADWLVETVVTAQCQWEEKYETTTEEPTPQPTEPTEPTVPTAEPTNPVTLPPQPTVAPTLSPIDCCEVCAELGEL